MAASDDITGGQGDWQLEEATGVVESALALNPAELESYKDILATTVGNTGLVTTNLGGNDVGAGMALQSDGKILLAGYSNDNFALVRYNINGALDASFSGDGWLTTDIGSIDYSDSVIVQTDGKIILAGYSGKGTSDFALVRYNSDGSLDTSFSGDGMLTTDLGGIEVGRNVILQLDGKILLAGFRQNDDQFALARYNSDGSLDTSFSDDGWLVTELGGHDYAFSSTLQPDGKILLAGSNNADLALVRYNSDGSLDTSFSGDGIVTKNFDGSSNSYSILDYFNSVVLQPDGKILLGGISGNHFAMARFNSDGSLDSSFSSDGLLTTTFGGAIESGQGIALQSDGKILMGGYSDASFAIARYHSDGTLDNSFSGDGLLLTHFASNSEDYCYDIKLQSDGKILLGGSSNVNGNNDFALARYNSDGSLDTFFNSISSTPPTLSSTTTTNFTEQTPLTITNTLTLNDPDGDTSWNNGTLKLQITANNTADDSLTLPTTNNGGIWLNPTNNILMNNSTAIGTTDAASVSNGSLWTITFNAAATNALVQDTARAIQFTNNSDAPSTTARTVTFTATDNNGGTGSATQTINITAVNDAPTGTDKTVSINEDSAYTFSTTDFGYTDMDGNALTNVKIASLPVVGSLKLSGTAVTLNQVIAAASLASLSFTPAANANGSGYTSFNFTVNDGSTDSVSANTISLNVDAVNDAPTAANKTVTLNEDTSYSFSAADFGYSDSDGNALASVKIASLPGAGSLKLGGAAVTLNQVIPAASLASLSFTPTANANGSGYAGFNFTVNDGSIDSALANAISLNVNAVNDALTGTVSIAGIAKQGEVLTASNTLADSDGLGTVSYQWKIDSTVLATGNIYTISQADVGKAITVTASYTDLQGAAESKTSAATSKVIPESKPAFIFTKDDLFTSEDGDTAIISVKLATAPLRDVSVTFTRSDLTEGTVTHPTLTFTASNWSTAQSVTVVGVNDYLLDGNKACVIDATIDSSDVKYRQLLIDPIVTINKEDVTTENNTRIPIGTVRDTPIKLYGDIQVDTTVIVDGFFKMLTTFPGNDQLQGLDGNDTLFGGNLQDDLSGGLGNDQLYGDNDEDFLYGGDGNDTLIGGQGIDVLEGGSGNDVLDGGAGDLRSDSMVGGAGNDTYYLGYGAVDVITDNGLASDIDTVIMPYNLSQYTLPKGIEKGTISPGTEASNLTGNTSSNTLTGNDGKNILSGAVGKDSLTGGAGNDVLIGGAGNDVLTGGVGKDSFKFNASLTDNTDKIKDFKVIDDTIQLENAIFTKLTTTGVLNAGNFVKAATAHDLDDYVIYNPGTGSVTYDSDGAGAGTGVQIALLGMNLALTNADFLVI